MLERYKTHYYDQFGNVETTIENNGKELRMVVRDVKFVSTMLDDWKPLAGTDPSLLQSFTFHQNELCGFIMEFDMPISVLFQSEHLETLLHVQFHLGIPHERGKVSHEIFCLTLNVIGQLFRSKGTDGWIENELLDIQRQLPRGMYIQSCLFCAFSGYHPIGNGAFGQLSCFRKAKHAYIATKGMGKRALLHLYGEHIDENVQETYLCPEFENYYETT